MAFTLPALPYAYDALEHTDLTRSQLEELLNPEKLTAGGV